MSEKLPDGWKRVKLGKLITINNDNIVKNYSYSEILYLDTSSITKGKIDNFQLYELKNAPDRAKRLVKENDIVYSTVRPIQRHYGFITNPPKNLVVSTGFAVIRTKQEKAVAKFIYYFLTTDEVVETLDMIAEASTSTYPSLRPSDIENLEILIPEDINEQKAIAGILSSLDDKIDLLHRQNKTLEEMAQTLFRKWFIEDAQEDWEEVRLGDIVEIKIGRTPPRKEFQWFSKIESEENIKWVSVKDLGENGAFILKTDEFLTKEAVKKFKIPVIPPNTVLLSFKMTVGRVGITTEEIVSNEAIAHFKFNQKTPITTEYLYLFLKSFKFQELGSTSTIVTSINSAIIKDIKIPIPDKNTMLKFHNHVSKLFEKIKNNQFQIRTLEQLRDTLLPKLMSGEVRVKL
jgi:type I restriction enzyme S subunit